MESAYSVGESSGTGEAGREGVSVDREGDQLCQSSTVDQSSPNDSQARVGGGEKESSSSSPALNHGNHHPHSDGNCPEGDRTHPFVGVTTSAQLPPEEGKSNSQHPDSPAGHHEEVQSQEPEKRCSQLSDEDILFDAHQDRTESSWEDGSNESGHVQVTNEGVEQKEGGGEEEEGEGSGVILTPVRTSGEEGSGSEGGSKQESALEGRGSDVRGGRCGEEVVDGGDTRDSAEAGSSGSVEDLSPANRYDNFH